MTRILIKDATVITLDDAVGDLSRGSVLVEDGTIAAVAPDLDVDDADVVNATGTVVCPGFVDTHRHTWQTALRGIAVDWSLVEYERSVKMTFGTRYTTDDTYTGNFAGALDAIDCGVTCLLDFSHGINSPEHADAALKGLRDSGIRAVFGYGMAQLGEDPGPFADHESRLKDARRIRELLPGGRTDLVRMALALTETGVLPWEATQREIELARELEILVTHHTGCAYGSPVTMGVRQLHRAGLLGADQVHVHCNALADDEMALLAQAGAWVSITPESELQMGMGQPVTGRCLEHGIAPTLGVDVLPVSAGDMFTPMRLALQCQRCLDNAPVIARGEDPPTLPLRARDALTWATRNGAAALGLDGLAGVLRPGARADLIVLDGEAVRQAAVHDPAGAVVMHAQAGDVKHVLIDGEWRKRDGKLCSVDLASVRSAIDESRERLHLRVIQDEGHILPPPDPDGDAYFAAMATRNLAASGWPQ